jgi:hypothetical protein
LPGCEYHTSEITALRHDHITRVPSARRSAYDPPLLVRMRFANLLDIVNRSGNLERYLKPRFEGYWKGAKAWIYISGHGTRMQSMNTLIPHVHAPNPCASCDRICTIRV